VQLLEDAVAALGRGELDTEGGAAATREAHKLAGSLGTFGMPDGTTQARAIERALAAGATPADAPALSERVAALWTTVQDGGPA
jgi:HPt (histidine-containing phosphotransfer) domain-containing protein